MLGGPIRPDLARDADYAVAAFGSAQTHTPEVGGAASTRVNVCVRLPREPALRVTLVFAMIGRCHSTA